EIDALGSFISCRTVAGRFAVGSDEVWLDIDAVPLAHVADSLDAPGETETVDSLVPSPTAPENFFVLASDRALEVRAPGWSARIEVQRPKWYLHLGGPTLVVTPHAGQ